MFTSLEKTWWGHHITRSEQTSLLFGVVATKWVGRNRESTSNFIKLTQGDPVCPVQNFSFIHFTPQLVQFSHYRADSKADGRGNPVGVNMEIECPWHFNLLQVFNLQAEPTNHRKGKRSTSTMCESRAFQVLLRFLSLFCFSSRQTCKPHTTTEQDWLPRSIAFQKSLYSSA